ncbi:hypothetical protein JZM24_12355 [Candidatus Sodalis endolongispinus]|uniref:Uncharacterized protein n=1 Tax=Candidatus Sodalis endolongispinus TaxID=2812662 RepID=A0ABS5YCL3_9GAMM|nr:hypothetical protein [Candidatus Sodalis endolongispinus]MBT9432717.1 hypothetical protein [Candidatus Sodalis endolongispinus]
MLSLVPFYDCIRLLRRGESANALQPCAFDALSLIPVIGDNPAFRRRAGPGRLVRRAVKVMACEQLLTAALKQGGAVFVRHGMLPAARQLTPRAFAALGIASLRSLDPGFELAGYIGRAGAARLIDFARFLQPALPSIGNVIRRFDARLLTAMPPVAPVYRTGRLPGLDREVPLVTLGGNTYHFCAPQSLQRRCQRY